MFAVWGVHYCVQVQLLSDVCDFFNFFYFLSFFHLITWNVRSLEITLWSTIVWFVWGVHYCVQLLPEVMFFNHSLYPVPLLKLFLTFLVSFICNSQKCTIFQNIWCLTKPNKKKKPSLKQFLKGVVHEQPWSTIVCLFGPTIGSSCFLRCFFWNIPFILFLC